MNKQPEMYISINADGEFKFGLTATVSTERAASMAAKLAEHLGSLDALVLQALQAADVAVPPHLRGETYVHKVHRKGRTQLASEVRQSGCTVLAWRDRSGDRARDEAAGNTRSSGKVVALRPRQ